MVRLSEDFAQGGMAGLDATAGDDCAAALPPSVHGRRPWESDGARALYLGSTIYRIHGTNQPETIGHAVSSGCFRLANGDVIDLFDRVPVGTKVIIRHGPSV